jgi:hypothetical protein
VIVGGTPDFDEATYRECADTVSRAFSPASGQDAGGAPATGGVAPAATSILDACGDLALFSAIASKAGRDLDYASFQAAGFALGPFTVPGGGTPSVYGPGKPAGTGGQAKLWTFDMTTKQIAPYQG